MGGGEGWQGEISCKQGHVCHHARISSYRLVDLSVLTLDTRIRERERERDRGGVGGEN